MFVKIDNQDMDAFKVEKLINETRDANGGVISPEFAMEILGKTNHFAHIKKVVNHIKKSCMDENGELVKDKVLAYKEFILSSVDGREMSPQALDMLSELAVLCGCSDEFVKANKRSKIYEINDCDNIDVKIVKSKEELKALTGDNLRVIFDSYEVFLTNYDLSKVKALKFKEGAEVELKWVKNLPECFDVSGCSKVNLRYCDLSGVKEIKFREGAEVNLNNAEKLPKVLDLSVCSKVNLSWCDFSGVKEIKFKEGAEVDLNRARSLPKDLDVSMCSRVGLVKCNLNGISLNFREGAEVDLEEAYNLPKELDLSMCSQVNLKDCDLTGVEKIKFKDRKQKREFMNKTKNFSGEVEYEETTIGKIGKVFNKEM